MSLARARHTYERHMIGMQQGFYRVCTGNAGPRGPELHLEDLNPYLENCGQCTLRREMSLQCGTLLAVANGAFVVFTCLLWTLSICIAFACLLSMAGATLAAGPRPSVCTSQGDRTGA